MKFKNNKEFLEGLRQLFIDMSEEVLTSGKYVDALGMKMSKVKMDVEREIKGVRASILENLVLADINEVNETIRETLRYSIKYESWNHCKSVLSKLFNYSYDDEKKEYHLPFIDDQWFKVRFPQFRNVIECILGDKLTSTEPKTPDEYMSDKADAANSEQGIVISDSRFDWTDGTVYNCNILDIGERVVVKHEGLYLVEDTGDAKLQLFHYYSMEDISRMKFVKENGRVKA